MAEGQSGRGGERKVKTFRDLLVWKKSMALVVEIYQQSKQFPAEEQFGLIAQIRRSATSIPCNISEGFGRKTTQDYLRFYTWLPALFMSCRLNWKFRLT